jgi:hypothetical protein
MAPGASTVKLFTSVIVNKLECLPLTFTTTLVQYLQAKLELTRVEPLIRLHCNGRLIALPANIGLRWKVSGKHSSVFCTAIITVVKSFIELSHMIF